MKKLATSYLNSPWNNHDHLSALASPRRIILQADVRQLVPNLYSMEIDNLVRWIFYTADQPGSQVDSIYWDTEYFFPHIDDRYTTDDCRKWLNDGIDIMAVLLAAARERGLECFLLHRFSEVERPFGIAKYAGPDAEPLPLNCVKEEHPDWVVQTWWWQGMWNLASDGLKQFKVDLLSRLMGQYDFDGLCIDFARHVPCLPPGQQWENRDHVTTFMQMLREAMAEVAKEKQHPILVGAKVPENERGCRIDGFDVTTWVREELVDLFVIGARTMNVDLAWFRSFTSGTPVRLFPAYEDGQPTDGYHMPGIEFFRGLCDNWWHQGADGIVLMNFTQGTQEMLEEFKLPDIMKRIWHQGHITTCRECGSPDTLHGKDILYAMERRGGFPYASGYFNRNDDAPLPAHLPNDGSYLDLSLNLFTNPAQWNQASSVLVKFVVYGPIEEKEKLEFKVNGIPVSEVSLDYEYKDAQISAPLPSPPSGSVIFRGGNYDSNPEQHLLACTFVIKPCHLQNGTNILSVRCRISPYFIVEENLTVEKVELMYRPKVI